MIKSLAIITMISLIAAVFIVITYGNGDDLDVIVLAGQSNAEYSDEKICKVDIINNNYSETPAHKLLYYGTEEKPPSYWNQQNDYDLYPMWDNGWRIGGYEPILANEISKKTGNDVLVINMAISGRKIADLMPGNDSGDYCFNVLKGALDNASKKYSHINKIGWIWIQGEADYYLGTPADEYEELFVDLKNIYNGYGLKKCYIVHTRDYYGGYINDVQEKIAALDSNVYITGYDTEDFTVINEKILSDEPIHYSQYGRITLAYELVDIIIQSNNNPLSQRV